MRFVISILSLFAFSFAGCAQNTDSSTMTPKAWSAEHSPHRTASPEELNLLEDSLENELSQTITLFANQDQVQYTQTRAQLLSHWADSISQNPMYR